MIPRQALYVIGAALVALLVLAAAWMFDPFGRRDKAEAKATVATQQAEVADATVQAQDRVIRVETTVRQMAQEGQNHVQEAQGAETPLDAAVAASIRAGVDRLRNPTTAGADQPATEPQSPL